MDKQKREQMYSEVLPGWWGILDKYVPQILAIAPDAEFYIKEKFGLLRLDARSETHDWKEFETFENAAKAESSTVCECCGQPGKRRTDGYWHRTLCDRCAAVRDDSKQLSSIIRATRTEWLEKE